MRLIFDKASCSAENNIEAAFKIPPFKKKKESSGSDRLSAEFYQAIKK